VEHLVDVVGDVLGRLELDLPRPVQEVRARELAGLRTFVLLSVAQSIACATEVTNSRQAFVSMIASPT